MAILIFVGTNCREVSLQYKFMQICPKKSFDNESHSTGDDSRVKWAYFNTLIKIVDSC